MQSFTEPFAFHMVESEFQTINFDGGNETWYNKPFTSQLTDSLNGITRAGFAPGKDIIMYFFLQNINLKNKLNLLHFFNYFLVE